VSHPHRAYDEATNDPNFFNFDLSQRVVWDRHLAKVAAVYLFSSYSKLIHVVALETRVAMAMAIRVV
jgi:hypothetical protein